MKECSQNANFGLSCYAIELKDLVRIARYIGDGKLSKRSLRTGTSALENGAGATSRPSPPLSVPTPPILLPAVSDTKVY
jgi:hypothetical protein